MLIDIIGPMPVSDSNRYCLTIIDRYTRWPTALPMENITAETVAKTLISGWISIFGTPLKTINDLGRQFESGVFRKLTQTLKMKLFLCYDRHIGTKENKILCISYEFLLHFIGKANK